MCCSSDRWTCPVCGRTIVVGESEDVALELYARRLLHETSHNLAAQLLADAARLRRQIAERTYTYEVEVRHELTLPQLLDLQRQAEELYGGEDDTPNR